MTQTTDANARALDAHYDQPDPIGQEDGQTCNRVAEPDEDAPRGYRPKPCAGSMVRRQEGAGSYETQWMVCDTCGEIA